MKPIKNKKFIKLLFIEIKAIQAQFKGEINLVKVYLSDILLFLNIPSSLQVKSNKILKTPLHLQFFLVLNL